jgi:hypothetical protein
LIRCAEKVIKPDVYSVIYLILNHRTAIVKKTSRRDDDASRFFVSLSSFLFHSHDLLVPSFVDEYSADLTSVASYFPRNGYAISFFSSP